MIKKICNVLNTIIILLLIIVAGILIVPQMLGMNTLAVLSGSMQPNIPVGSLIIIDDVKFDDLKVDDVITYKVNSSTLVTHRIVSLDSNKQEMITKGDANEVDDGSPISYQNVVGKLLFTVPLLGYLSVYMKTPLGIAILCGIIFVLIVLNFLPGIFEKE